MAQYIEKAEPITLPVIALHNTVSFPGIPVNFEANEDMAKAAAKIAGDGSALLFLTTYNDASTSKDFPFYRFGVVAKIKQMLHTPEGQTRIFAEGITRAAVEQYRKIDNYVEADLVCKTVLMPDHGGIRGEAACHAMVSALKKSSEFLPADTGDILSAAKQIRDAALLSDFIASHALFRTEDKQSALEEIDPLLRAELIIRYLDEEISVLQIESVIQQRVNERMNRNQREYYLREQIKVIQDELGEGNEVEEFAQRIEKAGLPEEVFAKLRKENDRLSKTPFGSAEATVIANYLDTCLDIPWSRRTRDRVDFQAVQKILDADHDGLEKVKERIVEYIAAKQMSPDLKNQILCLVGPPGVGKTSIASSIAKAMNRKYVRISLGGVRDEADIRGHRKTYIGAMPGRIITAVTQAGVCNPLILLDEIDKMTKDSHGDPTSALLEVLDPEQNCHFRDHFVEMPFDLSECMFIATANSLEEIPRPLMDRMEIIQLGIYTKREKMNIAKNHLIPKQQKKHNLPKAKFKITDAALTELIDYYTREAGVRQLERSIAALCRKAGKQLLEDGKKVTVDLPLVKTYLGERKYLPEHTEDTDEIGCVNGLAYTELGGSMLKVEVAVLEGTGKIETTGSLGDVMKESAQIAVSFVRSIASEYGIPADFYKTKDIHIHFPEGAVPKDGPSAGVTMVTALVSALAKRPVRHDIAMTGEISLLGKVLPIGGLKEKTMAAYNAGVKTVLIPVENKRDLEEIDQLAKDNLQFIFCKKASDVLKEALIPLSDVPAKVKAEESVNFIPTAHTESQIRFSES